MEVELYDLLRKNYDAAQARLQQSQTKNHARRTIKKHEDGVARELQSLKRHLAAFKKSPARKPLMGASEVTFVPSMDPTSTSQDGISTFSTKTQPPSNP